MKTKNTKIRICAVVTGKTLDDFIENLQKIQKETDLVELRVDYIPNIKPKDLDSIKKHLTKKAIFTCRRKAEYGKGKYEGSTATLNELIQHANDLGFEYIDIELREYDKILIHNKKAKIILSYHDWDKTDKFEKLEKLLNNMRMKRQDIIKIATMTKTEDDIKNITKLLLAKRPGEEVIIIGMGEKAAFTRSFAPLLGSYLTFASVFPSYTAPGQLDIKTVRAIYTLLGHKI